MLTIPTDSYVSVEYADAYHEKRTSDELWRDLSLTEKEQRLVSASDYIDSQYRFAGLKTALVQSRQFPRNGLIDIPDDIVKAVCELALTKDLGKAETKPFRVQNDAGLWVKSQDIEDCCDGRNMDYINNLLQPFLLTARHKTKMKRG